MKQHITVEQLNELSDEAKIAWYTWYRNHCAPFLLKDIGLANIGQMIEFLANHDAFNIELGSNNSGVRNLIKTPKNQFCHINVLCDTLWEAVKEVLEK